MRALKLSEDLRPLSELKTSPNDLVKHVEESGRPVILTRYGKGVAVLLSLQSFEDLEAAAGKARLIAALQEAQKDIDNDKLIPHEEMNDLFAKWEPEDEP